jgi:hypothetical protein
MGSMLFFVIGLPLMALMGDPNQREMRWKIKTLPQALLTF